MARPEPLQVVIQMRQVNEAERRTVFLLDPSRRLGDPTRSSVWRPLRCAQSRSGSPEGWKRKLAQVLLYFPSDRVGPGVDVEKLSAVRWIHRTRRYRIIHIRIHVVPPEQFCAGELLITLA